MRRFEFVEGSSSKFWEVGFSPGALEFTVTWGRIGTVGQTQTKSFASSDKASNEYDKLIAEKLKKGYLEVGAGAPPTAASKPAASKPAAPKAAAKLAPKAAAQSAPRVAAPKSPPTTDVAAEHTNEESADLPSDEKSAAAPSTAGTAALSSQKPQTEALPDPADEDKLFWDADLAARTFAVRGDPGATGRPLRSMKAAAAALKRTYGTWNNAKFFEPGQTTKQHLALLEAWLDWIEPISFEVGMIASLSLLADVAAKKPNASTSLEHLERFRTIIQHLPEAEYNEAASHAKAVADTGNAQVIMAFLFPAEPFSREIAEHTGNVELASIRSSLDPTFEIPYGYYMTAGEPTAAHSLVHRFGLAIVPHLTRSSGYGSDSVIVRADLLARCGTDEAFRALIFSMEDRHVSRALSEAASLQPNRAIRLLSQVRGKHEEAARARLNVLHATYPGLIEHHLQTASGDSARMLRAIAESVVAVPAAMSALPALFQTPPWTTKRSAATQPVFDVALPAVATSIEWRANEKKDALSEIIWNPLEGHGKKNDQVKYARNLITQGKLQPQQFLFVPTELREASLGVEADMDNYWAVEAMKRILASIGEPAIPYLLRAAKAAPGKAIIALVPLAASELAVPMAAAFATKAGKRFAAQWLSRHPHHAINGLIPAALAKPGKVRNDAERALRFVASTGHRDLVLTSANQAGAEVLDAVQQVLDLDPFTILPAKMPSVPEWCTRSAFAPLILRVGDTRIPDEAVSTVLSMLQISTPDEPYAGIELLRDLVTPGSLEEFAWSVFLSWSAAGFSKDGQWALTQLGLIGGDNAARKLSPLIRNWPGESAHARAVTGLDVLVAIGSDVSLMHLNRISETAKFKGLKDNAKERIAVIADARGLTREQLADRLVPDLGLDSDGSLWLDFGPRKFRVGFDELLAPVVRDENGSVLRALPKPNTKDDPELSKGAGDRWKALKKDATEASKVQMRRIELAMSLRRRWDSETFRNVFVDHPLMFHLARRLVWAEFDTNGNVVSTFRVAEDRTLATENDDPTDFPEANDTTTLSIGIPHPMQLDEKTLGAWGTVFSDYEILQPFAQLGRERYALSDTEKQRKSLERFTDLRCHFGKILALEHKGWQKGSPQDAGVINTIAKPLADGRWIEMQLTQGLWVGVMSETPEQNLGPVKVVGEADSWNQAEFTLGSVDPIEMSEVLRDLELMR